MPKHNLHSLLSDMTCNIACTIHMNLSFNQEIKHSKPMKSHINDYSNQWMHKSTKICNTSTSSINFVMQIMQYIYLTDALSYQHFTTSMVTFFTGVAGNNLRHI